MTLKGYLLFRLFCVSVSIHLPSHVLLYLFFIQAHGADTVPLCPEVPSPVPLLQIQVPIKHLYRTLPFQKSYHFRNCLFWRKRYHQVHMVSLDIPRQYFYLSPFTQLSYNLSYRLRYVTFQNPEPVFWTPYYMVFAIPYCV